MGSKHRPNLIKVLFIAGCSRSGSTLLEQILAQVDGFNALGEVQYCWSRVFAQNHLCSCGVKAHECPFWTAVAARAFGGMDRVDAKATVNLQESVASRTCIPQLIWPGLRSKRFRRDLAAYSETLCNLLAAARDVSGAQVLIDSSKMPAHGFMLHAMECVDLYVVHIVRDSRGVVHSLQRKKRDPGVYWKTRYITQRTVGKGALDWITSNVGAHLMAGMGVPYLCVRYEDLVREPRRTISRIVTRVTGRKPRLDFLRGTRMYCRATHSSGGNPVRARHGPIEVRLDDEWHRVMPWQRKLAVTALTWPLLAGYGYMCD